MGNIRILYDTNIKIHCDNGPAMVLDTGPPSWFFHGARARTYKEFQELSGISDGDLILLRLRWGEMYGD